MPLAHGDPRLAVVGLVLRRRPREVVPPDLYVIVREFAQLVVVHAEEFGFLRGAQVQTGDVVDDGGEDGGHGERVAGSGDYVGDLDVELSVIV